jgi:hypothetical protein
LSSPCTGNAIARTSAWLVCEQTIIGHVKTTDRVGLIVELWQTIIQGIEDPSLPENASALGSPESFLQVQAAQAADCRELTKTEICRIIEDHRCSNCVRCSNCITAIALLLQMSLNLVVYLRFYHQALADISFTGGLTELSIVRPISVVSSSCRRPVSIERSAAVLFSCGWTQHDCHSIIITSIPQWRGHSTLRSPAT